jgi:hypothetical protein
MPPTTLQPSPGAEGKVVAQALRSRLENSEKLKASAEGATTCHSLSSKLFPKSTLSTIKTGSAPSRLPDLLAIRPLHPSTHSSDSHASLATKPFALTPLPYTDDDVPLPEAYNDAYPHPLTAYASPGVNPMMIRLAGYDKALDALLRNEPAKALGSILDDGTRKDVCVPSLSTLIVTGQGNGIPERLWELFANTGLPVGNHGVSPYAQGVHAPSNRNIPPRFMGRSGSLPETPADLNIPDYFAQMPLRRSISSDHGSDFNFGDGRPPIRRLSEYDIAASMAKASFGGVPFYKTELCPSWDSGDCRYGDQCQVSRLLPRPRLR